MEINADLIDDLARSKVVLFLGAGVSASAVTEDGHRLPGWEKFLKKACAQIPTSKQALVSRYLDRSDYLSACELIQKEIGEDAWPNLIVQEFGKRASPSELHKAIANLDQRLMLTTNFDKILESTWETSSLTSTHYPVIISNIDQKAFRILKENNSQFIVKLHGTVDDPRNIVFSRSEYIKLATGNDYYISLVENLLLNYTFLFIGFSMDDPAVTGLMEQYTLKYAISRPHYILTSGPIESEIIKLNRRLRKLIYLDYGITKDHSELPPILEKAALLMKERRREIFAFST